MKNLIPLGSIGKMTVWRRGYGNYFVSNHETAKILEEFTHKRKAIRWAKQNKNG